MVDPQEDLFAATGHIINERTVNVGASHADRIEEGICIRHKVFLVGEFVRDDLGIAGIAQHHQSARYAYGLSPCTCGHVAYTDPF